MATRDRVGVVVPAGGSGKRLGGEPKQFRPLGDAPVLVQTLRAFARHPDVGPLVVAAPEERVDATARLLAGFGVEHERSGRYLQNHVFTRASRFVAALTLSAGLRLVVSPTDQPLERRDIFDRLEPNAAPVAAMTPVRPTLGHVFQTQKRHPAVAALSSLNCNLENIS